MDDLRVFLERAERLLVFTGAGISTNSGIPDFRGPQGVWKTRQPVYFSQFLTSEEARIEYWEYKLESWPSMRDARPNAAHYAIVDLLRAERLLAVVTQNIDGLHQKAGIPEELVIELHGTNRWIECLTCRRRFEPQPLFDAFAATVRPPRCPHCTGWLKSATISFGQDLDPKTLRPRNILRFSVMRSSRLAPRFQFIPPPPFPLWQQGGASRTPLSTAARRSMTVSRKLQSATTEMSA